MLRADHGRETSAVEQTIHLQGMLVLSGYMVMWLYSTCGAIVTSHVLAMWLFGTISLPCHFDETL